MFQKLAYSIFAIFFALFLNTSCFAEGPTLVNANVAKNNYLLDTGDILEIYIPSLNIGGSDVVSDNEKGASNFKENFQTTVNQDGVINVPPFGEIRARGKDVRTLQVDIEDLFVKYLKNPKVFVTLKVQRSYLVYIFGEVKHPGAYQFLPTAPADNGIIYSAYASRPEEQSLFIPKLTALIKRAGGLLPYSDTESILITNPKSGKKLKINLSALLKNQDTFQDPLLDPDDQVLIAEADKLNLDPDITASTLNKDNYEIRVIGYATKSGAGSVELDSRSMTLLNALGKVNVDKDADLRKVTVLRKEHNSSKLNAIVINILKEDFSLQPDDTVLLINRKFSAKLRDVLQTISNAGFGIGAIITTFGN